MTKKEMIKMGVRLVVMLGVETILANVIGHTTIPGSMGIAKKVSVGVSTIVLGSMLGDHLGEYTDKKIDEYTDKLKDALAEEKAKNPA